MKLLLLDSNKTIENFKNIKNNQQDLFRIISEHCNININVITEFYTSFKKTYGSVMWEYHPLFWRSFADECLNKNDEKIVSELYNLFLDYYEKNIELFDDTIEFLKSCHKKYYMALVANGNDLRVSRFIDKFNLNQYFDDIVISGETPFKKPDSFMFEYVLKKRNVNVSDAVMIGDRYDTDIIGAKKIGIKTILIRRNQKEKNKKYTNPYYMPDFSTYSLNEVDELLKYLSNDSIDNFITEINQTNIDSPVKSALILAGGKGSRLGEIGKTTQKCMLPIRGKPLLFFMINALKNAGCNNIVIVVNHLGYQIKNYFGDGENFGLKINYIEGDFVSTYDAVYNSLSYLDNSFYYCHGNIVFEERLLEKIWRKHLETNTNVVSVLKNSPSVTHSKMILDGEIVKDISFEPKSVNQKIFDHTFMGVAIYKKNSIYDSYNGNKYGMTEKHIKQSIEKGISTYAIEHTGKWWHIETREDYERIKNKYYWEVQF